MYHYCALSCFGEWAYAVTGHQFASTVDSICVNSGRQLLVVPLNEFCASCN